MAKIINHQNLRYLQWQSKEAVRQWNGAYYYSKEIYENFIPNIKTDRNWVTVGLKGECYDHSIVFIHNNLHPENYRWLEKFNDLILVCSVFDTTWKVEHLGQPILLPLSIDVEYVKQFERDKDKEVAFVGRSGKKYLSEFKFPEGTDILEDMPREQLLAEMARYKKIYAVGRCALEGIVLGCEILPYDKRYTDPTVWKVMDNSEAVDILQKELDKIDNKPQTPGLHKSEK